MSTKNQLQEYFQKKKLPLPQYTSTQDAVTKAWSSTVYLYDNTKFTSSISIFRNKKEAEFDAAKQALNAIEQQKVYRMFTSTNERIAIFVDLENCPKEVDELVDNLDHMVDILVFVNKLHPLSSKEWRDQRVKKVVVSITAKDAADISMILHIGSCLLANSYDRYVVITKDHFGQVLTDLINSEHDAQANIFKDANDFLGSFFA